MNNIMNSERDDLPSASGVYRLMNCQASHRMTLKARGMRQEAGESGGKGEQWREQGNAMHDAIFNQSAAGLETDQERMDYSKLMKRFRDFLGGWGADNDDTVIREERLWLHQEITPIFSGRPDYCRISKSGRRAAIVEFKSLWNKEVEPAENDQLWSQAVLLAAILDCQEFTLQIISPHYTYKPHLVTRHEIEDYEIRLRMALSLAQLEKEPPRTGPWCKHCGGIMICPAIAREAAMTTTHPSELKLENAGKLLARLERMEKYIKEVREYYKLVIAKDPEAIPGWKIIEKSMRLLKNPQGIKDAVVPIIGEKAFWGATSVSITKLETAWAKAKEAVPSDSNNIIPLSNVVLAPFITIKTQEASLQKDKKHNGT